MITGEQSIDVFTIFAVLHLHVYVPGAPQSPACPSQSLLSCLLLVNLNHLLVIIIARVSTYMYGIGNVLGGGIFEQGYYVSRCHRGLAVLRDV